MQRHPALALLMALVALVAPVAAAGSLPDPTWIAGMYDGGDSDDLVALVWDLSPAAPPPPAALIALVCSSLSARPERGLVPFRVACPHESRAPPLG